ncbi:hypothetical protein Zmor_019941 [Zophobas morio]|uniref:Gustatory receptor n=1 Tax=Zophobas morio TaxID=2755281 RepID=A0AA38I2V0_9CUCU|nr:hypothetical protein Zmor_019941 [Zophobas morio]
MNSKLPIKNIKFIKPLFLYLNIFLIAPWYDFNKLSFRNLNISKLYGSVLILVKFTWLFSLTMNENIQRKMFQNTPTFKVLYTFWILNQVVRPVMAILKSTFWDINKWTTLITNFELIDTKLQIVDQQKSIFQNFYFRLGMKHVVVAIWFAFQLYAFSLFLGMPILETFWFGGDYYREFLMVVFINTLIKCFKERYEYLNAKLLKQCKNFTDRDFRQVQEIYRLLGENVDDFSHIFGYQIICVLFRFGLEIISCLNYSYVTLSSVNKDVLYGILAANLCSMIFVTCNVLMVILPIDEATQEAKKFMDLCYKLQEQFPHESKELDALSKLTVCCKNFQREFTAAGFFNINKRILFALGGNVATYYIITIQLNESQYQKCQYPSEF